MVSRLVPTPPSSKLNINIIVIILGNIAGDGPALRDVVLNAGNVIIITIIITIVIKITNKVLYLLLLPV